MVTIPKSLQPSTMIPGAITVAQQKAMLEASRTPTTITPPTTQTQQPTINERATQLAYDWVNRKLQGKRIVRAYYGRDGDTQIVYNEANKLYVKLLKDPYISRKLSDIAPIAARARELGFDTNIQEYVSSNLRSLKEAEQVGSSSITEPKIIKGPTSQSVIQEGPTTPTPLYYELGKSGEPVGNTVYTSPLKSGQQYSFEEIKSLPVGRGITKPSIVTDNKPVYLSLEELNSAGGITPGKEPTRYYFDDKREFTPSTLYLGDKQITTTTQPQFGTIISTDYYNVKPYERIDVREGPITQELSTGIKSTYITEKIPTGAGIALTQLNEFVYVRNSDDVDKLKELLGRRDSSAPRELRIFLREQQLKLKEDQGRYNLLLIKLQSLPQPNDRTPSQNLNSRRWYDEAFSLRNMINAGQLGTLREIIYTGAETYEAEGKKVEVTIPIFGIPIKKDVSPKSAVAGLLFGERAYDIATDTLALQIVGAGAGTLLSGTKTGAAIIKGINTIAKPLRYTTIPTGFAIGGITGIQELKRSEEPLYAIAAGAGTTFGFFSSIYSRQIFEGLGKISARVSRFAGLPDFDRPQRFYMGTIEGKKSKLAQKMLDKYLKNIKNKELLAELKKGIVTAGPQELQTYSKVSIKKILNSSLSFKEKVKEIKLFLDIFKGTGQASYIVSEEGIKWQILDAAGRVVARGQYFLQLNGLPLSLQDYPDVATFGPFQTTEQAVDLTTKIKTSQSTIAGTITKATTSQAVAPTSLLFTTQETAQVGRTTTGLVSGVLSTLKNKKTQKVAIVGALAYEFAVETKQETKQENDIGLITNLGSSSALSNTISNITQPITIAPPLQTIIPLPITQPTIGGTSGRGRIGEPLKPTETNDFRFIGLRFPGEDVGAARPVTAYQGEVLSKGKYVPVTKSPHTKSGAQDVIARVIDNTVSAQGRVVPVRKKVKAGKKMIDTIAKIARNKLEEGDGYYKQNKRKFRGFKIVKGKQVPLGNSIIEKRGFRSDTPGEKRGLTVAQNVARTSKRRMGLPTRKRKGIPRI